MGEESLSNSRTTSDELELHRESVPSTSREVPKMTPAVEWIRNHEGQGLDISLFTHNDPDVDAMSTAIGLSEILTALGHKVTIYYHGQAAHPQNRVFMNQFDWTGKATRLKDEEEDIEKLKASIEGTTIIIVDTSCLPGTGNMANVQKFINKKTPALVIDHHEKVDQSKETTYQRCQVGACATMIWEIAEELEVQLSREASTALLLGIELDTSGFREDRTTDRDTAAYEALRLVYDGSRYLDVINYPKSSVFRSMKRRAYCTLVEADSVLVAGVGIIDREQKHLMASIADELMNYDNIQHALVMGLISDEKDGWSMAISYRTSSGVVNADDLVKSVFGNKFGAKKGAGGGEVKVADPFLAILQNSEQDEREEAFNLMFRSYAGRFSAMRRKLS